MGCCFSSNPDEQERHSRRHDEDISMQETETARHESEVTATTDCTPSPRHPVMPQQQPQKQNQKQGSGGDSMSAVFGSLLCEEDCETRRIQFSSSWEALAKLLQIDVEDPLILVLSGEMYSVSGAEVIPMCIEASTWDAYCRVRSIQSASQLRSRLGSMRASLSDPSSDGFKRAYNFAFDFIREPTSRNVSAEDAIMYWNLLIQPVWSYADDWVDFVQKKNAKVVTRDEWSMLLDLIRAGPGAVDDYDPISSSWPLLVDDFLDDMQNRKKQQS
eukprot:TRINITY_DN26665_c0_g1_i1.p1 TRINITY_DN26665_c0_g1~~TRINITY_DN26665_c0_g1_i1.p1  ORF type:complete len:273 (+),score=82.29 TRINITY_DN26665_c0_g1_i1:328-1146(+)